MAGETTVTVVGGLTDDAELRFIPASRGFGISDGVPCPNCGYTDPH